MTAKKKATAATAPETRSVVIAAPHFESAQIKIVGTSPLVLHKFAQKSKEAMIAKQEAGQQGKKVTKRAAKDFNASFEGARHRASARHGGWDGFTASAIRNAMISACRVAGFKMTIAKLSVFCVADGYSDDGDALVKITKGTPTMDVRPARNDNGAMDIRARPMWAPGWEATVTLRWDADQFSATDVANLLARAGAQVGVGEGRADSRESAGLGWGHFEVRP